MFKMMYTLTWDEEDCNLGPRLEGELYFSVLFCRACRGSVILTTIKIISKSTSSLDVHPSLRTWFFVPLLLYLFSLFFTNMIFSIHLTLLNYHPFSLNKLFKMRPKLCVCLKNKNCEKERMNAPLWLILSKSAAYSSDVKPQPQHLCIFKQCTWSCIKPPLNALVFYHKQRHKFKRIICYVLKLIWWNILTEVLGAARTCCAAVAAENVFVFQNL